MQPQYILNKLPLGVAVLDHECRLISFSQSACGVFGEEELHAALGKTIHSIHHESSRAKIDWLLAQAASGETLEYASMLINVPDTVLQLRVQRLMGADGPDGYCLVFYDITDLTSSPAVEGERRRSLIKLPVSHNGRTALVDISKVSLLLADGHYTEICVEGTHHFCGLSLAQLQVRLHDPRFLKVHRSSIVNLDHIETIRRSGDQFMLAMMGSCKHEIPVSRAHQSELRDRLGI